MHGQVEMRQSKSNVSIDVQFFDARDNLLLPQTSNRGDIIDAPKKKTSFHDENRCALIVIYRRAVVRFAIARRR